MIDILSLVEQDIEARRKGKERSHKVFYASELGYCPLRIYYSIVRPLPFEVAVLRTFRVGDLIHAYIQELLEAKGAQSEVPIRQLVDPIRGIELHGRIDVIHEGIPYELKSTSRLPSKPHEHHVDQLNAYLNLLGVREGYLVYFEKNTMDIAQYRVRRDEERWHAALSKIQLIHDVIERHPDDFDGGVQELAEVVGPSKQCRWCRYRNVCPLAKGVV